MDHVALQIKILRQKVCLQKCILKWSIDDCIAKGEENDKVCLVNIGCCFDCIGPQQYLTSFFKKHKKGQIDKNYLYDHYEKHHGNIFLFFMYVILLSFYCNFIIILLSFYYNFIIILLSFYYDFIMILL